MGRPPPPRRPPRPGGETRPDGNAAPAAAQSLPTEPKDEASDLPETFFLGRYRVVDEIGVGGMASVHLARVDGPGGFQKWVAIKRIHPHLVEDDQFVDMFLDEARIAAGINHANVAQVFDLGKDDNTYWIAMEYLHGEPLREVMRRLEETGGQLPFHLAARICSDAAEGLHGAHELRGRNGQLLNLVHRDVTPHNLFCTYDGYTKVVDFGIAKVVDRLASTRAGTLKGKLAYMSPEQVRGQDVDRRTDVFALGVVLWEITTGRRLFRRETDLDTLEQVQACVVPLPSTLVADFPPGLEQVVMKALAQRPEDRFQTAREFSRAMQRYLMKQGTFVGPEDVGDYITQLFRDRVEKRERYLEWAAEVTSHHDLDQLQPDGEPPPAQRPSAGSSPSTSRVQERAPLPTPAAPPTPAKPYTGAGGPPPAQAASAPPPQPQAPPQRPAPPPTPAAPHGGQLGSAGEKSASAAVVAPIPDLAATSIMEEEEDIPTVVAQPRYSADGGIDFDGMSTQIVGDDPPGPMEGMDSTIALPDGDAAGQIQAQVQEMDAQRAAPGDGPAAGGYPVNHNQNAVETKMSLPRPAAVAQWLMEQGEVEIQGPRSTGVIIAIAALATLCVMGVASLIVYKLKHPPVANPAAVAAPAQPAASAQP